MRSGRAEVDPGLGAPGVGTRRSSAGCARSSDGRARRRRLATCCSARACTACCARPGTRRAAAPAPRDRRGPTAAARADRRPDRPSSTASRWSNGCAPRASCARRGRSASTRTSTPRPRDRAIAAGFDLVVPRSRMAREGPALVARLLGGTAPGLDLDAVEREPLRDRLGRVAVVLRADGEAHELVGLLGDLVAAERPGRWRRRARPGRGRTPPAGRSCRRPRRCAARRRRWRRPARRRPRSGEQVDDVLVGAVGVDDLGGAVDDLRQGDGCWVGWHGDWLPRSAPRVNGGAAGMVPTA